ncbi:hypothetical protein M407DRAFT_243436 [Tulasnella calospora MUT 4182]|uniref:Uncharacterized protein n=1 Tax=Tulasnella calospora MUT 4182 TaxID=1051891 RepID=A0A0C3L0I7_9AGAM|nr:hypothetical protein M407DRAFT_243436 [Tulasnella calospora MUT 4182]
MPQVFRDDDQVTDPSYSNVDAAREDRDAAQSESTGQVSKQELNDLGGRTNILDDKDGVQTRGKKVDAMKQERDVDAAVENAVQYDFETGGQKIPEPRN